MIKVNEDLVAGLRAGKTAIARRVYSQIYNKDKLHGVFADGYGHGYVEDNDTPPLPGYALRYIRKFIKHWKPAK